MLAATVAVLGSGCGAEGGGHAAADGAAIMGARAQTPSPSAEQRALLPPMTRYETDFVTIDLPEGFETSDESYLGSIGLYGGDDTLAFEVFTAVEDSVGAQLEREATHPTGLFQSFGWKERGRESLGDGVLVTGMGGGTSSQPNRPIAYYVGPDGKGGLVEMKLETAFGTKVPPERVYALAEAMATSMVVDELPDEDSYAAFRSSRFGEIADVPYKDGTVDVDALAPLTQATLETASQKALAFAGAYDRVRAEGWSPARVRDELVPMAREAATEHRALEAYAEAWSEVTPKGDPGAPAMRALGLVGDVGYGFLWDLGGHVTRVAELKERGRDEALAELRAGGTDALGAQRDLYAYALAAYAAAKVGEAAPERPRFSDPARAALAEEIEKAAADMRLAVRDPAALKAKYPRAAVSERRAAATPDAVKERRLRAVRAHLARMGGSAGGSNAAGLDPFSNVTAVRVYGGMSTDPWD